VGFPAFKGSLQGHLQASRNWSLDGSLIHLGPRYGYRLNQVEPSRFDALTLVNLFATFRVSHLRKVELGFGVSNLLGSANPFIQGFGDPASGGNPPIPGPGREFSLRLSHGF
jgi:outer membrane receptor protein involved in Fe transport